jgi:hypothetical protein
LSSSGAKYLRSIVPSTLDKPGHAKLRILDSFSLTTGDAACALTQDGDGRHFYPLDLLQLRIIAEGALSALGELLSIRGHEPKIEMTNAEFLVSPDRLNELKSTHDIGWDLDGIFRRAFRGRHIAFIGDSTTTCMRHKLVAWMLATSSTSAADTLTKNMLLHGQPIETLTETINDSKILTSEVATRALRHQCPRPKDNFSRYFGGRCAYVAFRCTKSSMLL